MSDGLKLYKSYSFIDKDPIIDQLRTAIHDTDSKWSKIEAESGVSHSTLHNWFNGQTRRPQFATVMAVARSIGYDLELVDRHASGRKIIRPRFKRAASG